MPNSARVVFVRKMAPGCKFSSTHFNIAFQVLFAVKDSNAAPSPNTPVANASRGKVAAPKARAKAVSQAKARVKAKNVTPQKTVAPAVVSNAKVSTPEAKTSAPETKVSTPEAKVSTPQAKVSAPEAIVSVPETKVSTSQAKVSAPEAKVSVPETKLSTSQAKVSAPEAMTPEILFPEALTPKVVPAKSSGARPQTALKTANSAGVAPKVAPAKTAIAGAPKVRSVSAPVAAPRQAATSRLRPLVIFAVLAALITTVAGGVAVGSYNNWSNRQVIAPKVRVAGEPIGGMTREQAIAHLDKRFGKLAFTLQTGDKNIVLGLAAVGGKPSIEPTVDKAFAIGRSGNLLNNFTHVFGSQANSHAFMLPIEWKRGALTSRLKIVNKQYARPAVDARLVTVSGGAPRVADGETGRALDVSATADAIQKSYFLGLGRVKAVASEVAPQVTAADLAGRDVKLGEYRTTYNGGIAGRTTNIHVACRAVDGTVLMPGEVLSFNGLTGERTYKKGYRMAHVFMREAGATESSIVDGLAGGVCQVSSTLYNAVRKANAQMAGKPLGIVERSSHSLPVTYVPSGRDATVAWPSKDFKFRNDNAFPVYVRTAAGNGRLTISIWGRVPQNQAVPIALEN